jgi:RNA ligase (TIGR02306 family)
LRGQVSQGLLLPMSNLTNYGADLSVGDDVTEQLGILKWEAPVPANLSGDAVGLFPIFIPKTDQERIQNLTNELHDWSMKENTWEVTEKLDGSSMTVFVNGDESGVCSRNLQLKESEGNSLWVVTNRESLIEKVKMTRRNLALQGEIIGEGIQGNSYKLRGQDFFLFDVYDIDERRYLSPWERRTLADKLSVKHVPVIKTNFALESALSQDIVYMAEGKSSMCEVDPPEREGIVFKRDDGEASFKAISNKFLMKNGA